MPGICLHCGRSDFPAHFAGDSENHFLGHDAQQGRRQGNPSRTWQFSSAGHQNYPVDGVLAYHHSHAQQGYAYYCGRKGLIFPVSVIVVLILGLCADFHENEYDDVGQEVTERMDRVRNHCGRVSQDTGNEFECKKHHVHDASHQGYLVYFLLSFHFRAIANFKGINIF